MAHFKMTEYTPVLALNSLQDCLISHLLNTQLFITINISFFFFRYLLLLKLYSQISTVYGYEKDLTMASKNHFKILLKFVLLI